jgi:hypothetical protein
MELLQRTHAVLLPMLSCFIVGGGVSLLKRYQMFIPVYPHVVILLAGLANRSVYIPRLSSIPARLILERCAGLVITSAYKPAPTSVFRRFHKMVKGDCYRRHVLSTSPLGFNWTDFREVSYLKFFFETFFEKI